PEARAVSDVAAKDEKPSVPRLVLDGPLAAPAIAACVTGPGEVNGPSSPGCFSPTPSRSARAPLPANYFNTPILCPPSVRLIRIDRRRHPDPYRCESRARNVVSIRQGIHH